MLIRDFLSSGGIDVLERTAQFAEKRHQLIVHNIANLSTPRYQPSNVDPDEFRNVLANAVEKRRSGVGSHRHAPLELSDTRSVHFRRNGLDLQPKPLERNVMFHDQNDRDLERTMQDLAENVMVYRQANELLRSRFQTLQMVIRERV